MSHKKLLICFILLLPISAIAQEQWTLKRCIEFGLKNHRSNAVYVNQKKIADAQAREALAAYLPSISVNGELDDNIKPQTSVIPAGVFGTQTLRVAFTQRYSPSATVELDQTIFDKSLLTGLQANRYNKEQAGLNIRQNDESLIYNISTDYYQISVYREQLRLQHINLETYSKQMEISSLQVKKGVALQKDLDKVKVDYNNTQSQTRVAESSLTLAENQLKYDMGMRIDTLLQVDNVAIAQTILPEAPSTDSTGFNANLRVDFRLSQVNEKLLEIDEQKVKSGAYPKLTAFARFGGVGFGDNLNTAFSGITSYSVVGLKLSVPVFDFFKRNAQYGQAKYKRINAQENLQLDVGRYRMEYENARTKVLKERANVDNNRNNVELASSVFCTTDLQYQKGTTDLTDWLNTQNSLKEAQNNYLQSLYNYMLARIDLEKAAGTLKEFYSCL